MKHDNLTEKALEVALKRAAPPLSRADKERVARVCDGLAGKPIERAPGFHHALTVAVLRVAACLVLAGSVFVLFKTLRPVPVSATPHLASIPHLRDIETWESAKIVTGILSNESSNLVSDIATLTTILNERSLAILF